MLLFKKKKPLLGNEDRIFYESCKKKPLIENLKKAILRFHRVIIK